MFTAARNTFIAGGTFNDNRKFTLLKDGFQRLQEAVVPGAFHNSGERFEPPKCHPNTRVAVLKRIMDWIHRQDSDTRDALIMWLYGPAGAGKSAIAQTLAEMCYSEKKLLASFFFSKNDPLRKTGQSLVATLAYQLALNLPLTVREHIASVVEHDPLILTRSLEAQFAGLIAQPIQHLAESGFFNDAQMPRLIIIDGLDECESSRVQCNILNLLFKSLQDPHFPLLFLVASRPERDISSSFYSQSAGSVLSRLALDESYLPDADIKFFFVEKFEEIKQHHLLREYIPPSWPTPDVIGSLVRKSSGQFIYASTVVRFVASSRHRPTDRLEIILGIRPSPSIGETPFAELDALYTKIFSAVEDIDGVLNIIGLLIYHPSYLETVPSFLVISNETIEKLLFLEPGDVPLILSDLGSLISIVEDSQFRPCTRILHASLKDFLCDESRSKYLYLNPVEMHTRYTLICFQHIRSHSVDSDILRQFFHHCSLTIFNAELAQNIVEFSFEHLVKLIKPWKPHYRTIFIASYFSLLSSLPWKEDRLYEKQLPSLEQFFMFHLDVYYSNPFLSFLVAAFPHMDQPIQSEFPVPPFNVIDNNRLYLGRTVNPVFSASYIKYRKLLLDFLQNPVRSGKYHLDGAKYSKAALYALSCLCNHWSPKISPVYTVFDKNIRRYASRRWREKQERNGVLSTIRRKHIKICLQPRNSDSLHSPQSSFPLAGFRYRKKRTDHPKSVLFRFCLASLPHLLRRSDKSKELVVFARRAKFGLKAKDFPFDSKLAMNAIARYLARVSENA